MTVATCYGNMQKSNWNYDAQITATTIRTTMAIAIAIGNNKLY